MKAALLFWAAVGCAHAPPRVDANFEAEARRALLRLPKALLPEPLPRVFPAEDERIHEDGVLWVHTATDSEARAIGRATLAAALYASDWVAKWSDEPRWRVQSGWRGWGDLWLAPSPHPGNLKGQPELTPWSRKSPRHELAAFGAYFLMPPDDRFRCRWLSHARFWQDKLAEVDPKFVALRESEQAPCADFERWARLDELESVELCLANPSTGNAASLFGHLFLRFLYRAPVGEVGDGKSRTFAFLADTGDARGLDPLYPLKGIGGGYQAHLHEKDFTEVLREYVVEENRDIRRWRLRLSANEQRALLERLWTSMQGAAYDYYFFGQNCASLLMELLNAALPPERAVEIAGVLGRGPAAALDSVAFAGGADPLAEYEPQPYLGYARAAADAEADRRRYEEEMAPLGLDFEAAHAADAQDRALAYQRLAPRLLAPWGYWWLRASMVLEVHLDAEHNRHLAESLELQLKARIAIRLEELALLLPPDAEAGWRLLNQAGSDQRDLGYQAWLGILGQLAPEDRDRLRVVAALVARRAEDSPRRQPWRRRLLLPNPKLSWERQRYAQPISDLLAPITVTSISEATLAVQAAKRVMSAKGPLPQPEARADGAVWYQRAYAHSGVDRFSFAVGQRFGFDSKEAFVFRSAGFDEALGEQRRHGLPADTGLTVLAGEAVWRRGDRWPVLAESRLRLLGWRSLRPRFRWPQSWVQRLGFEIYGDARSLYAGQQSLSSRLGAGVLWPLVSVPEGLVLVGAGVAFESYFRPDRPDHHAGLAPLRVEARWALAPRFGYGHQAALALMGAPVFEATERRWHALATAEGSLRWVVMERLPVGRRTLGLSLVLSGRAEWGTLWLGEGRRKRGQFDLGFALD